MRLSQVVRNQSLSDCRGVGNIYSISGNADGSASSFVRLLSCITLVSLPVAIEPNLGDHTQTRNAENLINTDTRKHSGTWAKRFAKTAKPLFIGSIPIAASTTLISSIA